MSCYCSSQTEHLTDRHLKFWSLLWAHDVHEQFDRRRRSRMTSNEKALEQALRAALVVKDFSKVRDAYEQGADLIAGVFGQPIGKMSRYIIVGLEAEVAIRSAGSVFLVGGPTGVSSPCPISRFAFGPACQQPRSRRNDSFGIRVRER
jgi:hypothetical protein